MARASLPPPTGTPVQVGWHQVMTYQRQAPAPANPTHRPALRAVMLWSLVVVVFGLAGLVMTSVVTTAVGPRAALLALVSSAIALGIVVPLFLWVDRLESEPPRLLWFAFLWGALIATLGALVLNELGLAFFAGLHPDPVVVGAVFVAPVTEEVLKGLGVLLIFWLARREFDGVIDGIVYAGLVAAGFAFVENIVYLGTVYVEGGVPGLVALFVLRCLVSPFAHPMFTICIGLALGLVAHRRRWGSVWVVLLGLAAAVFLHALWNYSAVVRSEDYLVIFALVQVPLFVGFLLLLLWARRRESRILRDILTGYGLQGWFTPAEVAMLADPADPAERRRARAWARAAGGRPAQRAMRAFQDESGELAMVRKHIVHSGPDSRWLERERRLLEVIAAGRAVFVPGSGVVPAGHGADRPGTSSLARPRQDSDLSSAGGRFRR